MTRQGSISTRPAPGRPAAVLVAAGGGSQPDRAGHRSTAGVAAAAELPEGPRSSRAEPARPVSGRRLLYQLTRFATIGLVSTAAYAVLYYLLQPPLGAFAANFLALLTTALGNTAANRRLTFGVRGASGMAGDHAVGLVAFGAGLVLTSGSLATLHLVAPGAGRVPELGVLVLANAAATLLRFTALRLRIVRG